MQTDSKRSSPYEAPAGDVGNDGGLNDRGGPEGMIEVRALAELGRRATKLRATVMAVSIAGGILLGAVAYWIIRPMLGPDAPTDYFAWGYPSASLSFASALAVALVVTILGSRLVGRLLLRVRVGDWIDELCREHGLSRASFEDAARLWRS